MELFTPEVGLVFWMLIPFLVVFFILAKFAWPAILGGVEKRNQYIDESLLAAREAREALDNVKAESEALLEQARREQADILATANKSKDMIVNTAKEQANAEALKIMDEARKQISLEKEDAIRQIRREVGLLSVDIAEKVLREDLSEKNKQMDMIERLLDEINIPKS